MMKKILSVLIVAIVLIACPVGAHAKVIQDYNEAAFRTLNNEFFVLEIGEFDDVYNSNVAPKCEPHSYLNDTISSGLTIGHIEYRPVIRILSSAHAPTLYDYVNNPIIFIMIAALGAPIFSIVGTFICAIFFGWGPLNDEDETCSQDKVDDPNSKEERDVHSDS